MSVYLNPALDSAIIWRADVEHEFSVGDCRLSRFVSSNEQATTAPSVRPARILFYSCNVDGMATTRLFLQELDRNMDSSHIRHLVQTTADNVERVIIGKRREVELVLVALLCRGHVLIEDVPGVGKTVLTKAVARSIGSNFKRIQFTPDLLPSDVTGVNVFNQQRGTFEFRPGPVVAQMVLADEINRATPKTQAALLEAMEEAQISVDGVTHSLPSPFIVLATENPIDYEGTFPLPEAQLDRFLLRLSVGYPGRQGELEMLDRQHLQHPLDTLQQVVTIEDLVKAQETVKSIHVAASIREYIVTLVDATRHHDDVFLGASPRGSLALFNASRAWAGVRGREFVTPDDVKLLAEPTLAHRIIVSPSSRMRGGDSRHVVRELLGTIPVPGSSSPAAVPDKRPSRQFART